MDDDRAHALVAKRVEEDSLLEDEVGELVLAAFGGSSVVELLIEGGDVPELDGRTPPIPLGAYVTSIAVEGFRGVGPQATLEIEPGPGLTLIVGRNGSGKSTFAEGLEVLFTGDNKRWSTRSMVWREGWRNLHHPTAALDATLAVEGRPGVTVVRRTWPDGAGLEQSSVEVQSPGLKKSSLSALGWDEALINYRPFLSYNELGSMLDEGPSKLHDAITRVLGLDDLSAAEKTLREVRLERERALKDVMGQRSEIVAQLEALDDDRARACIAALRGQQINYAAAEKAVASGSVAGGGGETALLQRVAGCEVPGRDRVSAVAERIRTAVERAAELAGTQSDELLRSAVLLETAHAFRRDYPDDRCPVCATEGVITDEWMLSASEQAQRQRAAANEASGALSMLEASQREGRSLVADFPTSLRGAEKLVNINGALAVWGDWLGLRDENDPLRLASGLESTIELLQAELEKVKEESARLLREREDVWRPVASVLTHWLTRARDAERAGTAVPFLKKAEAWLKKAAVEIRNERFAPIADEAAEIWRLLRHRSNVQLGRIELEGTGTRRKISLDVTVDGVSGAALGVMSQGELHALALSLFFPRATLPESPFRFIVIDDPVQSMDPAKVDGLARVLDRAARQRQVLVFTHDDRLPEAIRRLQLAANVIEVTRKEQSVVELRPSLDPVERHIADARAVASTSGLPKEVARRVVPGFCRMAVEAGCLAAVRRRRIERGESHAEVETMLASTTRLTSFAALALFDDKERGGDVLSRINSDFGAKYATAFQTINKGTHQDIGGNLHDLIRDSAMLAREMEQRS